MHLCIYTPPHTYIYNLKKKMSICALWGRRRWEERLLDVLGTTQKFWLRGPEVFPVKASWGKFLGPFVLTESLMGGEGPWAKNCESLGSCDAGSHVGQRNRAYSLPLLLLPLILTPLGGSPGPPGLLGLTHPEKTLALRWQFPCCLPQPFLPEA